jgi:hypothetical protein
LQGVKLKKEDTHARGALNLELVDVLYGINVESTTKVAGSMFQRQRKRETIGA